MPPVSLFLRRTARPGIDIGRFWYDPGDVEDSSFGPFEVDGASSRLLRDGTEVKMRPQAFAALRTLIAYSGRFSHLRPVHRRGVGWTAVSRQTVKRDAGESAKVPGRSAVRGRLARSLGTPCGARVGDARAYGSALREPAVGLGWSRHSSARPRAVEARQDHRAFEGQAACYLMMASFGTRPGREMFQAFLQAHERAVSLVNPTPELCCNYTHAIHMYQRRLDESLAEFNRVIALSPQLALAHVRRTLVLVTMGNLDAALDSAAHGLAAAPLQPLTATAEVNVRICGASTRRH